MGLIGQIVQRQRSLGMGDRTFARHLGVAQPTWTLIRCGHRRAGLRTLRAVQNRFPELQLEIASYLLAPPAEDRTQSA